jgi:hypothetical protein
MKKLFSHDADGAITASALLKITTSGKIGPRIYRVILDGKNATEIKQKIADYVESLKPHYRDLHNVDPTIEWEILCEGECIGIGSVTPTKEEE